MFIKSSLFRFSSRLVSGLLPFLTTFIIPLISDLQYSSNLFSTMASIQIIGSICRFGFDQIILKNETKENTFQAILIITTSICILLSIIFSLLGNMEFKNVIILITLNSNLLLSNYLLTNNRYTFSLFIQFIFPNISIITLTFLHVNIITNLAISYGLPFIFMTKFHKINISWSQIKNLLEGIKSNLVISTYNVLSILIANLPILLSYLFLSELETIQITQALKTIGLSSFLSAGIIFTVNNKLRSNSDFFSTKAQKVKRISTLLVLGIFLILTLPIEIINFSEYWFAISILIILFTCLLIMGNFTGHYYILYSREMVNLISITKAMIFIGLVAIIYFHSNDINSISLIRLYIIALTIEAYLKIQKI